MVIFNKSIKGEIINFKIYITPNILLDYNSRGKLRKEFIFKEKIELKKSKLKKID